MGIGDNKGELIPSWIKLFTGLLAITYGLYLLYGPKVKANESESESNKTVSKNTRPSHSYLIVGVLLMSLTKYLIKNNDFILNFWIIIVGISGLTISIYGLIMFFKERRDKKESGSIE